MFFICDAIVAPGDRFGAWLRSACMSLSAGLSIPDFYSPTLPLFLWLNLAFKSVGRQSETLIINLAALIHILLL